jgi:spore germination protein GerM
VRLKDTFFPVVTLVACLTLIATPNAGQTPGKGQAPRRKQVKVYLYHDPGEYIDLAPVKRYVNPASPARAAIIALLNGPTAAERSRGFDGLASASEFSIGSLQIKDGTARINFVVSRTWAGFPGDTAPIRFKKAVELTLQQFPNVRRVSVTLNGDSNFAED